jgi:hypothetical protein
VHHFMIMRSERYPKRLLRNISCGTNWYLSTRCKISSTIDFPLDVAQMERERERRGEGGDTGAGNTPYIQQAVKETRIEVT